MSKIHFIAIGGSAMHNLALALHKKGFKVTGSDDEILEPSRTRLQNAGLLPAKEGWFPKKVTVDIDAVILGMHARADNPELIEAQKKGIRIFSYPEYLYEFSKDKKRVVIGGSHGKTTITSMILHVLKLKGLNFDYMVGAQLEGFDTMVKLSDAPVIVLEGDEYLASPLDRRPKFHLYHPHIALISGIAWDHINVFPQYENYVEQFKLFVNKIEKGGSFIYCRNDDEVLKLATDVAQGVSKQPYGIPDYVIENGITYIHHNNKKTALKIFGEHNLMNMEGARCVCNDLGIDDDVFYEMISSFKGAAKRLEFVGGNNTVSVFKDFAHSPSKLKATTNAVKQQFGNRKLIACMELHTFSSLNENFLEQYKNSMNLADEAYVYFNPHTIEHKKLKPIGEQQVKNAFNRNDLKVYNNSEQLIADLLKTKQHNTVYLMMSSGNFDGVDLKQFCENVSEG